MRIVHGIALYELHLKPDCIRSWAISEVGDGGCLLFASPFRWFVHTYRELVARHRLISETREARKCILIHLRASLNPGLLRGSQYPGLLGALLVLQVVSSGKRPDAIPILLKELLVLWLTLLPERVHRRCKRE